MPHLATRTFSPASLTSNDPEHTLVTDAVRSLVLQGETLYYTQQNRREFWNVCTRPVAANGSLHRSRKLQRLAEVDTPSSGSLTAPKAGPNGTGS